MGIAEPPRPGLARAYDAAVDDLGYDAVLDLLKQLYANATPQPWHLGIAKLPWEAIWTFNVDDVMETAYNNQHERVQFPTVVTWSEATTPYGGKTDEVPLVHMHGYVGAMRQRPKMDLVFGLSDYLGVRDTATQSNWHTAFRGSYPTCPAIVVGAQLSHEIDLAEVVRDGNRSALYGLPSLIVRPDIPEFDRREYVRWGLIPVDATAQEFFDYLEDCFNSRGAVVPTARYRSRYTDRTFIPLPDSIDEEAYDPLHDFYGGHEPMWRDILADLDAVPTWLEVLASQIGSPDSFGVSQQIISLVGPPFSGKSTSLLRLTRLLQLNGWEPEYLGGRDAVDVNQAQRYLADRPRACLVVDNLHFDLVELTSLLERCEHLGQPLLVVAAERNRYRRSLRRTIPGRFTLSANERTFVPPTDALWWSIVERRADHARLGVLEGRSKPASQRHFLSHGRSLYSALASLEDADGFIGRGLDELRQIDPSLQVAFAGVAIVGSLALPVPTAALSRIASLRVSSIIDSFSQNTALGQWVDLDLREPGSVRLRHRYMGDLFLEHVGSLAPEVDLPIVSGALCRALAGDVSPSAIRRRTTEYRIVAELMDEAFVKRILPTDADVESWYARIEDDYRWNARFWEQRALAQPDSALDRAYSYAKRAVEKHRDPFTLNTLGTILMRRSMASLGGRGGSSDWLRYWRQGGEALVDSRRAGRGQFEYPYMTFLSYTRRVCRLLNGANQAWESEAAEKYREWVAAAEKAHVLTDSAGRSLIDSFPESWQMLNS